MELRPIRRDWHGRPTVPCADTRQPLMVNMGSGPVDANGGQLTREQFLAGMDAIAKQPRPGPPMTVTSPKTIEQGREAGRAARAQADELYLEARRTRRWRVFRRRR